MIREREVRIQSLAQTRRLDSRKDVRNRLLVVVGDHAFQTVAANIGEIFREKVLSAGPCIRIYHIDAPIWGDVFQVYPTS